MINPTLVATRFVCPQIKGSGAAEKLETILGPIDGVRDVETAADDHSVCVTYNSSVIDRNGIISALQRAGYTVEGTSDASPPAGAATSSVLG